MTRVPPALWLALADCRGLPELIGTLHGGHIGDYVAWLVLGMAVWEPPSPSPSPRTPGSMRGLASTDAGRRCDVGTRT